MTEPILDIDTKSIEIVELKRILESILLVADESLEVLSLAATLDIPSAQIAQAFSELEAEYADRGINLREINHGWRFYTSENTAKFVETYVRDGQVARLTQAALETLAVIAYKQPVSRARVSAIRGVNVDGVVKTLESRGLIEVAETESDTGALLYRTTGIFLEKMGLKDLSELPVIAEYLPDLSTVENIEG